MDQELDIELRVCERSFDPEGSPHNWRIKWKQWRRFDRNRSAKGFLPFIDGHISIYERVQQIHFVGGHGTALPAAGWDKGIDPKHFPVSQYERKEKKKIENHHPPTKLAGLRAGVDALFSAATLDTLQFPRHKSSGPGKIFLRLLEVPD